MRTEKDILQDMERANVVRKTYEQQLKGLEAIVGQGSSDEVAKALKFTTAGLKRVDRELNRLNKELGKHIGDKKRNE
jgi:hypothetical protein